MDMSQTEVLMKLSTQSVKDQQELHKATMDNQLDASDRILLRKAADVSLNIAELAATDPT